MKHLSRTSILFFLLCAITVSAFARPIQDENDAEIADQAISIFTTLLKSKNDAEILVHHLREYKKTSPWRLSTDVALTQKLLVAGFHNYEILSTLQPCGDLVAALDGNDGDFENVVMLMAALKTDRDTYENLSALKRAGVPTFQLLGEATAMSPEKVERLALQGQVNSAGAFKILREAYTRRYGGIAEKVAEQRRQQN